MADKKTIKFDWQPSNAASQFARKLIQLGLGIGGDDENVSSGTEGTVTLWEVGGKDDAGEFATDDRLICTWHGKFHRDASKAKGKRITFQLNGIDADGSPNFPEYVSGYRGDSVKNKQVEDASDPTGWRSEPDYSEMAVGYDPECVFGFDSISLWFANRIFRIFFPFQIDSRREGTHLELQARASLGGSVVARSGVLRLPIRRRSKTVATTSGDTYRSDEIGASILSHSAFLMRKPNGYTAVNPATAKYPAYQDGSMKVALHPTLLASGRGLIPSEGFLKEQFPHQTFPDFIKTIRKQLVDQIRKTVVGLYDDAGFKGVKVLTEEDSEGKSLIATLDGAFDKPSDGEWKLKASRSNKSLPVPFWTTYVGAGWQPNESDPSKYAWAGLAQQYEVDATGVPYKGKVGAGDVLVYTPQQVMTRPFRTWLEKAVRPKKENPKNLIGSWWSRDEFDKCVVALATRVGYIIAHEVAHNIGMMHAARLKTDGKCTEDMFGGDVGVLTLMSPSVGNRIVQAAKVIDMTFSHQAKVIWEQVFGVTPKWADETLKNKTWTDPKTTWKDRVEAYKKRYETDLWYQPMIIGNFDAPPSWAGKTKQRGAHFK